MAKQNLLKLNSVKFGLAGGILSALCVLLITLFADYFPMCANLILEAYGRFGYSLRGGGIILGIGYGFIDGFILTWVFALIYNKLIK